MATLINVCGTGRSGSTMLDLMLGNAPNAFSCGEVSAWFRAWRTHHFEIDCPCGQDPCPVWEQLKAVPEAHFHHAVAERLGVDFVVDSSKDLCWLLDTQQWAATSGLTVFNLLMWKDPLDLAYSHWKRGRGLDDWRSEFVTYHHRLFGIKLPFFAVNYNQLVGDPQRLLAKTCAAIGMDYFEGKERFWEKEHHHLFGSSGTRKQVIAGTSTIRRRKDFPPAFERNIPYLRQQIAADADVQEILAVLKQSDVTQIGSDGHSSHRFLPKRPYPSWYYLRRALMLVQRYFPEHYRT